ncbi:hypothetical protein BUALT_Bualt08G0025400 [Buddleja alternifolia]|uniref:SWIM-type domain-containing protein n=1 Tax=Buddleja alternifolia TaxID=168488 RepID=A0AAV6X4Q8_9LAMI|nr:hypothetical protein BUALT_Bualt08G0025400 [Buddleja alternifolia]
MEKYAGIVCPNILKNIEKQRELGRRCFPTWGGADKFEVQHGMDNHILYLNEQYCSCGMFQLVGYPCCHVVASIASLRLDIENYVDDCFKKETYLRVYSHMVNPVLGMHDFEDSVLGTIDPPHIRIMPGRPKKMRRRDGNDIRGPFVLRKGLTHTCSICGEQGHNKSGHHKRTRQSQMHSLMSSDHRMI